MDVNNKSPFHLDLEPSQIGAYVNAAKASKKNLHEWVLDVLDKAAFEQLNSNESDRPRWANGLSKRTTLCLLKEGFTGKREIRASFEDPNFKWQSIPNFGNKCYQEVMSWLAK